MTVKGYQYWHLDICFYASIILNGVESSQNQIKYANGVAKLGAELLNDEGETSRNLVEHCVAERPMWLRRDLLLGVSRRHFQLQQRVKVIWILQNRSQTSHSSGYDRTRSVLLQFVTVLLWIFAHDDDYGGFFRSSPMVGS